MVSNVQQRDDVPSWDSSLRGGKLRPHQPKLARYPQKDNIAGHKQRQFNAAWYDEYPHLGYSICNDAVFCFVCQLFKDQNNDIPWCEEGVFSWDKMKSRGVSKKEGRNARIQEVKDDIENGEIIKVLLDITKTLAQQEEMERKSMETLDKL
eukprot:gene19803-21743_t